MRFRLIEDYTHLEHNPESVYLIPTLSYRAKGMLAYLRTLPKGTTFDIKTIQSVSTEGKQAVKTTLWELERSGYCEPAPEHGSELIEELPESGASQILPLFGSQCSKTEPMSSPTVLTGADRIIGRLNVLREQAWEWKSYTPLSSKSSQNRAEINKLLKSGYTEKDLVLVLEYLSARDGGDEKSRRYFDCVTPFRAKNFQRNLAMARQWEASEFSDPTDEGIAHRVIDRLNQLREQSWVWAVYTPLSSRSSDNTEQITDRLNDGFKESDLLLVLEYLASTEGGKEESRKYFDCVTPFSERNFERYLAMARDWCAKGRPTKTSIANPGMRRGSEYYERARKRSSV
jgi:hypothetical protein